MQTQDDTRVLRKASQRKRKINWASKEGRNGINVKKGEGHIYICRQRYHHSEATAAEISKNHEIYLSSMASSKENRKQ